MMQQLIEPIELTEPQFLWISNRVRELCGINLHEGKIPLVRARLHKRLRGLGLRSFGEYVEILKHDADGTETAAMLDALCTNLTYFFREPRHFELLAERALPAMLDRHKDDRRLRLWSAGYSSGEEPYSIAIVLHEKIPDLACWDVQVLATDLSFQMLGAAREGVYPAERLRGAPPRVIQEYFKRLNDGGQPLYEVSDRVRRFVHFARLNLLGEWPMKGKFDVVFCRNVMIYFDKPTQARLIERLWNRLEHGGTLFVGHSESLAGVRHRFRYVEPTVYEKP